MENTDVEMKDDQNQAAESNDTEGIKESDQSGGTSVDPEVKSYKCLDCNKQFKSDGDLEFHAVKSGHVNFEESSDDVRPLSEEEKQLQLQNIQERMKLRREERLEREKKDAIETEKNRRRMGQELALAKQKLLEQEMKRIAEEKRREKLEDKLAHQRVLDQIARDKQARKEKAGLATVNKDVVAPTPKPVSQIVENSQPKKEYSECKLQIRLSNGEALIQTFKPQEELAAVRLYIKMNSVDGNEPFTLMTNFPKKVFTEEDMCKPLNALGLVPTAVLFVKKGTS